MANRASTMCSHCTHLIRGIILGSCWTEKRLIENMIFQPVWRSRSWIKIYILWNHIFYVFLLREGFKRLHITDIGLIWFWLQSQISWDHSDRKQCSFYNEKYLIGVEYFPLSREYLLRYLPDYLQISHTTTPSIHPTIQF